MTGTLMRYPAGRWLAGLAGLVIVIGGLMLAAEGMSRRFMKDLRVRRMSRRTRQVVERLGVIGATARGVVFGVAGVLIIDAAVTASARKSGGLDKALLALRRQDFGPILLLAVASDLLLRRQRAVRGTPARGVTRSGYRAGHGCAAAAAGAHPGRLK